MTYNSRMQPATFTIPNVMSKTYDYQADGRLSFSHDLINSRFDRSYAYDHAGRITQALSGAEARNEGTTNVRPYKETFIYDAFGHLVERPFRNVWSGPGGMFTPEHQDYQNERNVNWQYDADGSLTDSGDVQYTIDAAGQTGRVVSVAMNQYNHPDSTVWGVSDDVTQSFDGDGQVVKKVGAETIIDYTEGNTTTTTTTYLVRSTVLKGRVVTEISETGQKQRTFVYLGSAVLAWQRQSLDNSQAVLWEHRDAGNASFRVTASGGTMVSSEIAELDPLGANAGITDPISLVRLPKLSLYPGFGDTGMSGDSQCILDGDFQPCSLVFRAAAAGGLSSMDVPWSISGTVPNRTPVWVPDNSKDKWIPDPEHGIGTYVIGDGGHYEWVPTGDVTTSIQSRQPQNSARSMDHANIDLQDAVIAALSALKKDSCRKLFGDKVDPTQLLLDLFMSKNGAGALVFGDLGAGTRTGNTTSFTAANTTGALLSGGLRKTRPDGTTYQQSYFSGAFITVNSNPAAPFRNGFRDFLGVGASDAVYRAALLIHELGHAARIIYHDDKASKIDLDTGVQDAARINRANTQRVYDNCFR